jgi:hypothetical protein
MCIEQEDGESQFVNHYAQDRRLLIIKRISEIKLFFFTIKKSVGVIKY